MRVIIHSFLLIAVITIAACSSGKKALKRGQYDKAVILSVERLQKKSSNKKATNVLSDAYPMAVKYHTTRIENLKKLNDNNRYEDMIVEYTSLNNLYDKIQLSPAALDIVKPTRYTAELEIVILQAAELHYVLGETYLNKRNKQDAKIAYNEFERAAALMQGNYKDCDVKMEEAMEWAVTKVIVYPVEVHSNVLKMSNDYFQNKIIQYLYEHRISKFVEFYSESEATRLKIRNDEILDLSFDDFVVGQLTVEKLQRQLIRDSVKVGETKIHIKETNRDTIISVYGKAKATLFVTRRTVESNGVLDMRIIDKQTNTVLQNEKLLGNYIWVNQFGYYQGDSNALSQSDWELTRGREMMPPPSEDLFIAFTQPIFTQLIGRITQRYKNY